MTKKIIIGIIIVIVALGLIGAASDPKNDVTKQETPVTTQQRDLAKEVQDAYLKQLGYSSIAELNLDEQNLVGPKENEITSFQNQTSAQVQVNVQDRLTKTEARSIAMNVLAMASDVEGLKTVFVVGSNGMNGYANKQ